MSFLKNKEKNKEAIQLAFKSLKQIGPLILIILTIMMFIQRFFTTSFIEKYTTELSGPLGYIGAAFLGAIVHIPLFISFPLGGELLHAGVNPGFIAVLITSLVMVHTFSIPVEIKEMGLKFAIIRNVLSLLSAIMIGIILGVLY